MTDTQPARKPWKRGRGIPDKREAILQAAVRLFSQHGFGNTTTKMISQEAGIAEGTIYLYFPSKKHILLEFARPVAVDSLKDTFEQMKDKSDEEIISEVLLGRIRIWQERRDLIKAVFAQAFFDKDLADSFRENISRPAIGLMESYLTERIKQGYFREINPATAARALLGQVFTTVIFFEFLRGESEEEMSPDKLASELTRLFLEGMKK